MPALRSRWRRQVAGNSTTVNGSARVEAANATVEMPARRRHGWWRYVSRTEMRNRHAPSWLSSRVVAISVVRTVLPRRIVVHHAHRLAAGSGRRVRYKVVVRQRSVNVMLHGNVTSCRHQTGMSGGRSDVAGRKNGSSPSS